MALFEHFADVPVVFPNLVTTNHPLAQCLVASDIPIIIPLYYNYYNPIKCLGSPQNYQKLFVYEKTCPVFLLMYGTMMIDDPWMPSGGTCADHAGGFVDLAGAGRHPLRGTEWHRPWAIFGAASMILVPLVIRYNLLWKPWAIYGFYT